MRICIHTKMTYASTSVTHMNMQIEIFNKSHTCAHAHIHKKHAFYIHNRTHTNTFIHIHTRTNTPPHNTCAHSTTQTLTTYKDGCAGRGEGPIKVLIQYMNVSEKVKKKEGKKEQIKMAK